MSVIYFRGKSHVDSHQTIFYIKANKEKIFFKSPKTRVAPNYFKENIYIIVKRRKNNSN